MRMHIFLNSLLTMYCSISIFMVIFIYFLSNWQIWKKHFTFIGLISFLILAISFYFKYNEKLNDCNILFKHLPMKVQLPIRTSTILFLNLNLGFILFILAVLTIIITANIWFITLCIFIIWNAIIYHPYIWFVDSINLKQDIKNKTNEFESLRQDKGDFEYFNDGFTYTIIGPEISTKTILWKDIQSIDVVRQNIGTIDEIQLYVLCSNIIIYITENTQGYYYFIDQMHQNFPEIDEIWQISIIADDSGQPFNILKKGNGH